MEKRDNEIFMQSPGRRYLAMPGKQQRRETTSVNERICSTLLSKKKRGLHRQKARNHIQVRSVGRTFRVIGIDSAKQTSYYRAIFIGIY